MIIADEGCGISKENLARIQEPFAAARPLLASAFYTRNIAYRWEKGQCQRLPASAREKEAA